MKLKNIAGILLRLLSSIVFPFGPTIEQEVAWVNACQSPSRFRVRLLGVAATGRYQRFALFFSFYLLLNILLHLNFAGKFDEKGVSSRIFANEVNNINSSTFKHPNLGG